jgi:hypothetical protein
VQNVRISGGELSLPPTRLHGVNSGNFFFLNQVLLQRPFQVLKIDLQDNKGTGSKEKIKMVRRKRRKRGV